MSPQKTATGIALMIAFCVLAPLNDTCAKLATATIPVGQIATARFVGQALVMLPIALVLKTPHRASLRDHALIIARALLLAVSTFCFVAGVTVMPIADALAIVFVMPFFMMFLGHLIFGSPVGPRRIAASLVGFLGAMLVIQPSLAHWGPVALFPLGTAFFFSFYEVITQALGPRLHPVAIQLETALWGTAVMVPLIWAMNGSGVALLDPVMPRGLSWLWLAGVGFWAAASHLAMTYALKYAPVSTLAPLHYLELVTAVIIGLLVWGTFPGPVKQLGIAIIIGSGLYIIHRERLALRQGRPVPPELPPEAV